MNARNHKPTKAPLADDLAAKVRALIARDGEDVVADVLEISAPTLGRAAGGMGIDAGTRALIELRIGRLRSLATTEEG